MPRSCHGLYVDRSSRFSCIARTNRQTDKQKNTRCAGGGRRSVINNFGDSRTLMITLTSTRLVVCKSVDDTHVHLCMWHWASHACCVVVELTRTTRVQNYAGSGIKRGNCWKCSSESNRHTMYMRNSSTSQMIQSVVQVARR